MRTLHRAPLHQLRGQIFWSLLEMGIHDSIERVEAQTEAHVARVLDEAGDVAPERRFTPREPPPPSA